MDRKEITPAVPVDIVEAVKKVMHEDCVWRHCEFHDTCWECQAKRAISLIRSQTLKEVGERMESMNVAENNILSLVVRLGELKNQLLTGQMPQEGKSK